MTPQVLQVRPMNCISITPKLHIQINLTFSITFPKMLLSTPSWFELNAFLGFLLFNSFSSFWRSCTDLGSLFDCASLCTFLADLFSFTPDLSIWFDFSSFSFTSVFMYFMSSISRASKCLLSSFSSLFSLWI